MLATHQFGIFLNNHSPQSRWKVVDLYLAVSQLCKYPLHYLPPLRWVRELLTVSTLSIGFRDRFLSSIHVWRRYTPIPYIPKGPRSVLAQSKEGIAKKMKQNHHRLQRSAYPLQSELYLSDFIFIYLFYLTERYNVKRFFSKSVCQHRTFISQLNTRSSQLTSIILPVIIWFPGSTVASNPSPHPPLLIRLRLLRCQASLYGP